MKGRGTARNEDKGRNILISRVLMCVSSGQLVSAAKGGMYMSAVSRLLYTRLVSGQNVAGGRRGSRSSPGVDGIRERNAAHVILRNTTNPA